MTFDKFQRTVLPDALGVELQVPAASGHFMALVTAENAAARTAKRPTNGVIVVILGSSCPMAIGCVDHRTGSKRSYVIDVTLPDEVRVSAK
jgi:hypothetical protein